MLDTLVARLRSADRVLLVSHRHPDGDAVGSLIALGTGLGALGKRVTAYLTDPVPEPFTFLEGSDSIVSTLPPEQHDLCVLLDLADAERTGIPEEIYRFAREGALACIDHHPDAALQGEFTASYRRDGAGATCALVTEVLEALPVRITSGMATALLTGIYTDTGGFQYGNTKADLLALAADLMRRGGRLHTVVQETATGKSVPALRLLGIALERIHLVSGGRLAITILTHRDISEAGGDESDLSGIANRCSQLAGPACTLLLAEVEPSMIRGSLRTNEGSNYSVRPLAVALGGGGHPRASGFTLQGTMTRSADGSWTVT